MDYKKITDLINNYNTNNKFNTYCILESVLRVIDIDLCNYPKYEIKKNVNIFRKILANDLIHKKLYKTFPNKLKFQKNDIYNKLTTNQDCDENIYKYISLYLELNIIIFKDNKYRYVGEYNSNINSIILIEKNNVTYIPIYYIFNKNIYNIFNDNEINLIIKNFKNDKRLIFNNKKEITNNEYKQINKLKNYSLDKLQELCELYEINIYKNINERKIYKKKIELFEEIKTNLINKII